MNNNYKVYRHIRLDTNQVFYIGIGKSDRPYAKNPKGRSSFWHNIVKKSEYRIEILFDEVSREFAVEKEMEFIELYGRRDLGKGTLVNMTNGGDGRLGGKCSDAERQAMRERNLGKKHSEETRRKMSESGIGRVCSDETKKKLSKAHKGKKLSMEHIEKIIKSKTGYKLGTPSEEHRIKLSISKIGGKNPQSKKVIDNQTGVIYDCIRDVAKEFDFSHNALGKWLRGQTKDMSNGKFSYYNEESFSPK